MISKSIAEGLKFALSPKKLIPYIILDLVIMYVLISSFKNFYGVSWFQPTSTFMFLFNLLLMIVALVIIFLVRVWIDGAMVDQAKVFSRKKPLFKSFEYSTSRYLTLICALVIYAFINWILSQIPYLGFLFSFILSLVINYFLYPAVIVGKKKCDEAIKDSYKTFMKYPFETFATWLLQAIISFIIIGLFAMPLIILFFSNILDISADSMIWEGTFASETFVNSIMPGVIEAIRSPVFVPYLFILVIALSFSKLFDLGVRTRLYMNSRKLAL